MVERILGKEHIVKKDTWKNLLDIWKEENYKSFSVFKEAVLGSLRRLLKILLMKTIGLRKFELYDKS